MDRDDNSVVRGRGETYRLFGAHLVDESMTIVVFGPWSGEMGAHQDFLNAMDVEGERTKVELHCPTLAVPVELPPVEDPDFYWTFMLAIPTSQIAHMRVREIVRRLYMVPLPRLKSRWQPDGPIPKALRGRIIFPTTRHSRLQSRSDHAKKCIVMTVEVITNMLAVGQEFKEPDTGKEIR